MNPADKAAIEAAKYNATMARRDAENLLTTGAENARLFADKAEQQLAMGMAVLGKTGNLGTVENAIPESGAGIGALETDEIKEQRKTLQKDIDDLSGILQHNDFIWKRLQEGKAVDRPIQDMYDRLKNAQDSLAALGPAGGQQREIQNPAMVGKASGSDLLAMISTRDAFERDKRTAMRNVQHEAMSMILQGESYDTASEYARQAADWNTFNTILGSGLKIAGMFL